MYRKYITLELDFIAVEKCIDDNTTIYTYGAGLRIEGLEDASYDLACFIDELMEDKLDSWLSGSGVAPLDDLTSSDGVYSLKTNNIENLVELAHKIGIDFERKVDTTLELSEVSENTECGEADTIIKIGNKAKFKLDLPNFIDDIQEEFIRKQISLVDDFR